MWFVILTQIISYFARYCKMHPCPAGCIVWKRRDDMSMDYDREYAARLEDYIATERYTHAMYTA